MQNSEMNIVARKLLMYFGARPDTSLLKGYVPAAIWLPIVAKIMLAPVKNLAARLSNLATIAGMYHSKSPPHTYSFADAKKIGMSAPRVPITGRTKNWSYPAMRFLEKRPKSGMLTARELKSPSMTFSPVITLQPKFMYVEVISAFPVTSGPPPCVTIAAHRKRARNVGGTITAFNQNKIRSFSIGIRARLVWIIQYRKKVRRPADVIPALAGRWFGKFANCGQIAVMQLPRKSPACKQRMAVHIAATNARRQIAAYEPYMPKTDRIMTGNGTAYVAPMRPVKVMTIEQTIFD